MGDRKRSTVYEDTIVYYERMLNRTKEPTNLSTPTRIKFTDYGTYNRRKNPEKFRKDYLKWLADKKE